MSLAYMYTQKAANWTMGIPTRNELTESLTRNEIDREAQRRKAIK